ncbi:MAG: PAS domain S-box-containing protein [Planctomycetota bacterium]
MSNRDTSIHRFVSIDGTESPWKARRRTASFFSALAGLTLALTALGVLVVWEDQTLVERARSEASRELTAILRTTQRSVDRWFTEQKEKVVSWSRDRDVYSNTQGLLSLERSYEALSRSPLQERLRDRLKPVMALRQYQGFIVFAPDGTIIGGSRTTDLATRTQSKQTELLVREIADGTREAAVSLPEHGGGADHAIMLAASAIRDSAGLAIGVLAFKVDPEKGFTEILQRGRIGESGESYAFNEAARMISESRFVESLQEIGLVPELGRTILTVDIRDPGGNLIEGFQPKNLRESQPLTTMASSATAGKSDNDLVGYRDYRGVPVIGAWAWDSAHRFGIATEIDADEAYSALAMTRRLFFLVSGIMAILLVALTGLFLKNQRHQAKESELRTSEMARQRDFQATLLDSIPIPIFVKDANTVFTACNKAYEEAFAVGRDQLIGLRALDLEFLQPAILERLQREDEKLLKSEGLVREEAQFEFADGEEHEVLHWRITFRLSDGELGGMIGVLIDISERKAAEEVIRRQSLESKLLHQVADMSASTNSVNVALEQAIGLICTLIDWPVGHIYFVSRDDNSLLTSSKIWYFNDPKGFENFRMVTEETEFKTGEGLPGRVLSSRESVWISELENDDNFPRNRLARRLKVKSGFAFPIKVGGDVFAVAEFFATERHERNKDLLQMVDQVAEQLSRVIERKQAADQLEVARREADDANNAKSTFLANMSHELRTPMNAVMGLSELCLRTNMTPKQQDYLQKIYASAGSLLGIINDILDFSKIEAGKLDLECISFDLDSVLDGVATVVGLKTNAKKLELLFLRRPDVPDIFVGDPLRLGQILVNLANNAVKFTEKGEIVLEIGLVARSESHATLKFSVRDTGIGMSQDQCGRLFQSFNQADASTTRKYGGTGLGLAICKQLAEMMGGTIWVESVLGEGSNFTFQVILEVDGTQDKGTRKRISEGLQGTRVLVVDDNPHAREALTSYLNHWSFDVLEASSGEAAIEILNSGEQAVDLILMDLVMPGLDGLETSRLIKTGLNQEIVPKIILVTAHSADEYEDDPNLANIDSSLMKPVNPSLLFNSILEALGHEVVSKSVRGAREFDSDRLKPIQGAKILLVEDNAINQQVATELLEQALFFVDVANNGQEAIDRLAETFYDCVLMDIQMPVMDGLEATTKIRMNPKFADLPVLAMTANAPVADRRKSEEVGMNSHISKPIDQRELFESLLEWIQEGDRALPSTRLEPMEEDAGRRLEVEGLDVETALGRLGGNPSAFLRLLKKFSDNQGDAMSRFGAAMKSGDHEECVRIAHTLKGLCGTIGADDLRRSCTQLEHALKSSDEDVLKRLVVDINHDLAALISRIRGAMQSVEPGNNSGEEVDELDASQMSAALDQLLSLIRDYDTEAEDFLEDILRKSADSQIKSSLKQAQELLAQYNFDGAAAAIDAILLGGGQ